MRRLTKTVLSRLAGKHYRMSKALWKREQRGILNACPAQPIINYQMGKVGSSTIQASLEARKLPCPVYHVHYLNPLRVNQLEQQRRHHFGGEREGYLRRIWLYQFLYEEIQRRDRRWKLITLVRDPAARNVSTFFENLDVTPEKNTDRYTVKSEYYDFEVAVSLQAVQPLVALFFDRLVHERPLRYFDDEVKTVFGIDVFAGEFPRHTGYQILKAEQADLLIIRLEDLDRVAEPAFNEVLGLQSFRLQPANVSADKIYAPLYKAFQRQLNPPDAYLDLLYNSTFARHFYTDAEIQTFRSRWLAIARKSE